MRLASARPLQIILLLGFRLGMYQWAPVALSIDERIRAHRGRPRSGAPIGSGWDGH